MDLVLGDCLEAMAGMEADSVDAIVTDPPYGLEFMGKEWDKFGAVTEPIKLEGDGCWAAKGFKNRIRFGKGIKASLGFQRFSEEWATAALRVLKPAHYLVAFGGTRTHHRLMVALEDAGFEIRDCLMWLYGSGFPKGRGQLKPAYEPIILCRKPGGKVRELGIDECRIAIDGPVDPKRKRYNQTGSGLGSGQIYGGWRGEYKGPQVPHPDSQRHHASGRWPANIVLDEEAASEAGDWSRYFYTAKASRSERNLGCEGLEERVPLFVAGTGLAKNGDGTERPTNAVMRNHHPTVKPVALMRWLIRLIVPPGGTVLDPFMGSGTTGVAAVQEGRFFVGIEREPEYHRIAQARIAHAEQRQMEMAV